MSLSKNKSLKFIINKLCVLSYYLNEIKTGKTIDIFKPELYNKRSGTDFNHNNYKYLYHAIRNNLEYLTESSEQNFNKKIEEIKDDSIDSIVGDNLKILTEIINNVLTKFNESITKLNDAISTIITTNKSIINEVLKHLQSNISIVDTNEKFKFKSYIKTEVSKTIQGFTDSATMGEKTFNNTKMREKVNIGLKGQIEQLKSEFYKNFEEFKKTYYTKKGESENKKAYIVSIIDRAQQLSDGSTNITDEKYTNIKNELNLLTTKLNEYQELESQVNAEVAKASKLIDETRKTFNSLKSKLEGEGESVIESFVDTMEPLLEIKVSGEITGYKTKQSNLIASIKDKYDKYITEQKKQIVAVPALQKRRWQK